MGARPGRDIMRGHLNTGRMPTAAAVWHWRARRRLGAGGAWGQLCRRRGCQLVACLSGRLRMAQAFPTGLFSLCGSISCTLAAPASTLVAALALRPPGWVM